MTQISFCAICLVSLACLSQAARLDNKILLFFGIGILALASGLRAPEVGIDTQYYYDSFMFDFTMRPWQFKEEGFRIGARLLMNLFRSPELVFLVIAIITNALIVLRLWDFREICSFSFMSFLYITLFYIGTMNTMRQYLAVAILFFATRYLEKRKYLVFVIALALASTIHTTALLGVAYLFVYVWLNAERKQRVYLAIAAVLLIPGVVVALAYYESGHIGNYFSGDIENVNITFAYRVGMFVIACLLMRTSGNRSNALSVAQDVEIVKDPSAFFYFLGLVASSAGLFFSYLSRLGYYYIMFEIVFWGKAVKREEWGWLFWLMPTVYALYTFAYELAYNGSGVFPFHFFFN